MSAALDGAKQLRQETEAEGIRVSSPSLVGSAFCWQQMTLVSEAVLTALDHYIKNGGGSRGARAICSESGAHCPEASGQDKYKVGCYDSQVDRGETKH